MAGLIVAGYDAVHKQGQVFKLSLKDIKILLFSLLLKIIDMLLLSKVWCVPIGGMCVRQPMTIGGSGSSYLYGMMDHTYRVGNFSLINFEK